MSTNRDVERIVRSWMDEGVTALPDRVLDLVLDQIPATPQRWSWWPARRITHVNKYVRAAIAAAAVLVVAVVGYNMLPRTGGPGGPQTAAPTIQQTPSPSPAPLAVGSFISHSAATQLDATGDGSNVTGTMTVSDEGGRFTVDLACARTTDSGLIVIGGEVTDSTNDIAPVGSHVAIILQRASPVKAGFYFEEPQASCPAFLETIPDLGDPARDPSALEPIEGTMELRP